MTGVLSEGLAKVGQALKEKKEKNIQNALKLQEMCETFEVKVGSSEFTAFIPPMVLETEIWDDLGKLDHEEYAKKHFEVLYGFPPETIEKMNRKTVSILTKAYFEYYGKVMRDRSFLDSMGSE
ncbi:hypothetical protein [Methanococcus maripaludis]|uniref:Uncharacterized protein n=1 Tax=Methanococcus maripaludis TaxID=39152 RepID=A0A8T4H154_METMI|nr:hypothetical protein [Methanococcus maripaludis]MBM7408775.1 hypothetical protein [Methanococcus maripaludis]MBP2219056.1 hypothetical protein [Methanococcus maripaludis]